MGETQCVGGNSNEEFARKKALQFSHFLFALREAIEYSTDLSISPWEFALPFDYAESLNVNQNDLQWMVRKGWIMHQSNCKSASGKSQTADHYRGLQFIISNTGVSALQCIDGLTAPQNPRSDLSSFSAPPSTLLTPDWDMERRELSVSGQIVKRFRWPAPNQETVLCVFAEEGWPPRIEDPLSQGNGLDPKRRLGDTIKCLNRNQNVNLVRFRGDGTGEGVLWDIADLN